MLAYILAGLILIVTIVIVVRRVWVHMTSDSPLDNKSGAIEVLVVGSILAALVAIVGSYLLHMS